MMVGANPHLFHSGDMVVIYENDLLQKTRIGIIVRHLGHDKNGWQYSVEFRDRTRCIVSERWLRPYEPPIMDDTRDYLSTLNGLLSSLVEPGRK